MAKLLGFGTFLLVVLAANADLCKDGRVCRVILAYQDPCIDWFCSVCNWGHFDLCPHVYTPPRDNCRIASCSKPPPPHHDWGVGVITVLVFFLCIWLFWVVRTFRVQILDFWRSLRRREHSENSVSAENSPLLNDDLNQSESSSVASSTNTDLLVSVPRSRFGTSRERVLPWLANYFGCLSEPALEERVPIVRFQAICQRVEAVANAAETELIEMRRSACSPSQYGSIPGPLTAAAEPNRVCSSLPPSSGATPAAPSSAPPPSRCSPPSSRNDD